MTMEIITAKTFAGHDIAIYQTEKSRIYKVPLVGAYPSATTIIGQCVGNQFPVAAMSAVEHARERGIEVHYATRLLLGGVPGMVLDWDSLDPEVWSRMKVLDDWREEQARAGWTFGYVERAFWHVLYRYACTPDFVMMRSSMLSPYEETEIQTVDVKPEKAPTVGLQTAAQALAVKHCIGIGGVVKRLALHLGKNSCKPVSLNAHATDRDAFLAAVHFYHYAHDRGII